MEICNPTSMVIRTHKAKHRREIKNDQGAVRAKPSRQP